MPTTASRSPSSQAASKKQASISSFFGKSTISKKPEAAVASLAVPASLPDNHSTSLFFPPEDPEIGNRHLKRSRNEAETHEDNVLLPTTKRRRSDLGNPSGTLKPIDANGALRGKLFHRTLQYVFSSSPVEDENAGADDDEHARRHKEQLHQKFVNKLGRPDSIAEIKRRNRWIDEEAQADEAGEEDEGVPEDESPKLKSGRQASGQKAKKMGSKLTPMEKQVLEIKAKHSDTLLVIEVGYKYRFFGEDARVAARELGIVCIPGKLRYDEHPSEAHIDRFASASIPVHRLHVHVKRLVQAGHKVGVVRQLETAALKAVGDNRNTPFVRKLTNLYTKGTYIDDIENLEGPADIRAAPTNTGYLLCITETKAKGWGTDEKVQVGFVAVQPATGDVIYDDFEDGFMRSEIETRLLHIAPVEFVIVGELSKASEKILQHLSTSKTNVFGDKARVERVDKPKTMAGQAFSHVSNFYADKMTNNPQDEEMRTSTLLEKVLKLSENVTICLSAMVTHLTDYGLEHVFDLTKYFQSFSARSHMLLNGTTLTSLEIYQNQTDHTEKGSLFWTLDRTRTRFGKRLLRKWVGRPLLDQAQLEQRVAAVEELKDNGQSLLVGKLKDLLTRTKSDLEKSLIRIYYGKCTRPELLLVLQTLQWVANEFAMVRSAADAGFKSSLINDAIASLPTIGENIVSYLDKINPEAAAKDDKYAFFRDEHETPLIEEHKLGIAAVEHDLDAHRSEAAAKLKKKRIEYVSVGGIEYQIEVDNKTDLKHVPASWVKISGTKAKSRFHTPEVVKLVRQRDQHKESLAAACDAAFAELLADIAAKYQSLRDAVQALATLDCLTGLAEIASQPGYVKPEYSSSTEIVLEKGRHPMVEQLLLDAYVPNEVELKGEDGTRALLITGPNMGGKSSYVRSVALIAIMGQIGSYVPADSARLGMLDAVFTRMGAQDNMLKGESTFMVELSETSDILKQASPRSLVILDELGRGTSTHDGVAIAQAVLEHIVRETKCLSLFITHYQSLSSVAQAFQFNELRNVHMRFTEHERGDAWKEITFLYEVADGMAHRSYGLNVARLAQVPQAVLELAAIKSKELEDRAVEKKLMYLAQSLEKTLEARDGLEDLLDGIAQL